MTHDPHEHNNLRINHDPEHAEMESLLDLLAKQDRDAMPQGLESRVLDEVSKVIAPPAISLAAHQEDRNTHRLWSMRVAAAAVLATGTTLAIVAAQPWASSPAGTSVHEITLASVTSDLDAYFSLDSVDDGDIAQAITDWEIWAQSFDTDMYTNTDDLDFSDIIYEDGAL